MTLSTKGRRNSATRYGVKGYAMDIGSIAGICTAAGTMATAIAGIVVSLKVLVPIKKTGETTHTIVNQQRTDAARYQADLVAALQANNIIVPEDKSLQ